MYDDIRRLCQMGNPYAYAYLLQHDWVMCAPNMPGAKVLRKAQDKYGNFWYVYLDVCAYVCMCVCVYVCVHVYLP